MIRSNTGSINTLLAGVAATVLGAVRTSFIIRGAGLTGIIATMIGIIAKWRIT